MPVSVPAVPAPVVRVRRLPERVPAQVPALAAAGYFAAAPNQRGYSPGARPDPKDLAQYDIEVLIRDALDLADALGGAGCRFHLVGHDWGGSLSWEIAATWPARVASLTSRAMDARSKIDVCTSARISVNSWMMTLRRKSSIEDVV